MTTERIEIWHCDAADCTASVLKGAAGWVDAIYTHGCPTHARLILAHKATTNYDTASRGRLAAATWTLRCACKWSPPTGWTRHNDGLLRHEHLAHVKAVTAPHPPKETR